MVRGRVLAICRVAASGLFGGPEIIYEHLPSQPVGEDDNEMTNLRVECMCQEPRYSGAHLEG